MVNQIIKFSIYNRVLVLILSIIFIAFGIYNAQRLSVDAVPDITNVQV